MSDESTKTPTTGSGDGAALRPTGKRQKSGQATTARANASSKAPEVVKTRSNPFSAIIDFFRGVFSEMGKVIWPTGREMLTYTIVVLVFLVLLTVLVGGVDYLTNMLMRAIFR